MPLPDSFLEDLERAKWISEDEGVPLFSNVVKDPKFLLPTDKVSLGAAVICGRKESRGRWLTSDGPWDETQRDCSDANRVTSTIRQSTIVVEDDTELQIAESSRTNREISEPMAAKLSRKQWKEGLGESLFCLDPANEDDKRDYVQLFKNSRGPTTDPRPFRCPCRGTCFKILEKVRSHLVAHTAHKPYQCPIRKCGRRFGWRSGLSKYLERHLERAEQFYDPLMGLSPRDDVLE